MEKESSALQLVQIHWLPRGLSQTLCLVGCHVKKTVLLPQHQRPLDSKVKQKNMLLMLLSLPVRAVVGGRIASFSPPAYIRAIYHFDRPFICAKWVTISLLLITHHKRHVMHKNIVGPVEHPECSGDTEKLRGARLRQMARVGAWTQLSQPA